MGFNAAHLDVFARSVSAKHDVNEWDTRHARAFAKVALGEEPPKDLADFQNRTSLKAMARNDDFDTQTVALAILAWGGMHRGNLRNLFAGASREWIVLADDMRAGKLDRMSSYNEFRSLRSAGQLKGMGPAYFTKLIHFLLPPNEDGEPQAFIMDQWAGCSINMLMDEGPIVWMDSVFNYRRTKDGMRHSSVFIVSDSNDGGDYDRFCRSVESLAQFFSVRGDEIDRALMSNGGRTPSPWRAYVMKHRTP